MESQQASQAKELVERFIHGEKAPSQEVFSYVTKEGRVLRRKVGEYGEEFAWKTSDFAFAPDSLRLLRDSEPVALHDGNNVDYINNDKHSEKRKQSEWGREDGHDDHGVVAGDGVGDALETKKEGKRTCSVIHCRNDVPNRGMARFALCTLHRRVTDGVLVHGCATPVRWCRHCNKVHDLCEFADSVIGLPRKLAYCERGRVSRLRAKADAVKADNREPATVQAAAPGHVAGSVSRGSPQVHNSDGGHNLPVGVVGPVENANDTVVSSWFTPRRYELSVKAGPEAAARHPAWNVISQTIELLEYTKDAVKQAKLMETTHTTPTLEDPLMRAFDEFARRANPETSDLHSGISSEEAVHGVDPGLYYDGRDSVTDQLESVQCGLLPGSTRLMVASRAPVGARGKNRAWTPAEVALALPSAGVLGCTKLTVSTFAEGIVGAAEGMFVAGETVTVDTSGRRLLSTPTPVTSFPPGVWVSAVVVLGEPIQVNGVSPGHRIHVFGQRMKPISFVMPSNAVSGGSVSVSSPSFNVEQGGGDVVPGTIFVQVIASGQSATGAEVRRVLVVPDREMSREIDALMRGAGGVDERKRDPLPSIVGYNNLAGFNVFHDNIGSALEAHWRSELYSPAGRHAVRGFVNEFSRAVRLSDVPATMAVLKHILDDVDAQEAFEREQLLDDERAKSETGPTEGEKKPLVTSDPRNHHGFRNPRETADGLDDVLFPISSEIRLQLHQVGSMIHITTVTLSILKSRAWGVSPAYMALFQVASVCYAVFFALSAFNPTLARWVVGLYEGRRKKGLPQRLYFESFMVFWIMLQNIFISTLFTQESYVDDMKWLFATVMHTALTVFLALWRAEAAPMKALRFDLPVQAALHTLLAVLVHLVVYGHLRHTRFGDGSLVCNLKFLFWYWFVPVAVATKVRYMYRKELRAAERARLAKKLT